MDVPNLASFHSLRTIKFDFQLHDSILFENDINEALWIGSFNTLTTLSPSATLTHIRMHLVITMRKVPSSTLEQIFSDPGWKHVADVLRRSPSTKLKIDIRADTWTASQADLDLMRKELSNRGIPQYELDMETLF